MLHRIIRRSSSIVHIPRRHQFLEVRLVERVNRQAREGTRRRGRGRLGEEGGVEEDGGVDDLREGNRGGRRSDTVEE